MKILHLIDSLVAGGRERRVLELLKEMRTYPHVENQLVVLSDQIQYDYAETIDVKVTCLPRSGSKDLSIFHKLYRLCRNYRPNIIHSWESMCSVYATAVAKISGIAFVNGMITDSPIIKVGSRKWVRSRLTFPFSDLILANSKAGLLAYKAPPHRSACVYNGFDFNRLKTLVPGEEIRRAHGIKTPKVIGMVANIDRRKDHLNFTRTAIHICNDRSDVSFIAIGEGPLRESCMQMVPEGLRDRIIFPGRRSDVESHVQIFDIGMLLSHREGISNAIIEYMASGKPVIATEGGGTPELVVHGETGFIVASNTENRVVQYIHYLLDTPKAAEQMGRAGRARIQTHFSTKNMCSETLSIYRSCLRRKTLPRGAKLPKGLGKHV